MKIFIFPFMFAFIGFGLPLHGENTPPKTCIVTIAREQGQVVRFGIDAERLWFFRPERCEELAAKAVGELKVDYARVPINCAYAREEDVTNLAAYTEVILPMMKAFRRHNPKLKFFASPRPLKEAYDRKKDAPSSPRTSRTARSAWRPTPCGWVDTKDC